jgi:hypothetical protein
MIRVYEMRNNLLFEHFDTDDRMKCYGESVLIPIPNQLVYSENIASHEDIFGEKSVNLCQLMGIA